MPSETLHFDNARQAQALYANEPKNLRLVEDLLTLKVTARDGWISLEGEPANIDKAKTLFEQLQIATTRGAHIRRQEFSQAVAAAARGDPLRFQELAEERVDVSARKRAIVPKKIGRAHV